MDCKTMKLKQFSPKQIVFPILMQILITISIIVGKYHLLRIKFVFMLMLDKLNSVTMISESVNIYD